MKLTLSEALKTDFVASKPIFDADSFGVPLTVHNISADFVKICVNINMGYIEFGGCNCIFKITVKHTRGVSCLFEQI